MRIIIILFLLTNISCQLTTTKNNDNIQKDDISGSIKDTIPQEVTVKNLSTTQENNSWKMVMTKKQAISIKAINTTLYENGTGKVDMLRQDSVKVYLDMEWSLKNDTMQSKAFNFFSYQLLEDKKTGEIKEKLIEEKGEYVRESKGIVLELTSTKMKVQDIDTETIYEYARGNQ